MPKKKTPKLPKKHTPNQAAHEEAKRRKQQSKRIQQDFDGLGNLINSAETRSKADEDVNQAAARMVREATEGR